MELGLLEVEFFFFFLSSEKMNLWTQNFLSEVLNGGLKLIYFSFLQGK